MGDLSENFSISEFCVSQTAARMGRQIIPDKKITTNIVLLTRHILQPIRDLLGTPVIITSGYRPEWLNTMIGGSKKSQHMKGQAADFVAVGMTPLQVCHKIEESDLVVDQLIEEFGKWVHVSWSPKPRDEYLRAFSSDGTTIYHRGFGTHA